MSLETLILECGTIILSFKSVLLRKVTLKSAETIGE